MVGLYFLPCPATPCTTSKNAMPCRAQPIACDHYGNVVERCLRESAQQLDARASLDCSQLCLVVWRAEQ